MSKLCITVSDFPRRRSEAPVAHAAPHVQQFIRIAISTGNRKTVISELKWLPFLINEWVDLDEGVIHLLGNAEAETRKRKGMVGMPKALLEAMKSWARDGSKVIYYKGKPAKRIDKAFRGASRRAGFGDVTPHTLKNAAVTRGFMAGFTIEMATAYFATSRSISVDVYRSERPYARREAAETMDRFL